MSEPLRGVGFVIESIEMSRKVAGAGVSVGDIMRINGQNQGQSQGQGQGQGESQNQGVGQGQGEGQGERSGREEDIEIDDDKGGLLIGQLISDSTEAFRLAFLSCSVSQCVRETECVRVSVVARVSE